VLADDLQRLLARQPVRARRGGRRYRCGRFVARHRLALTAAAAALLAFSSGLGLALWQRAQAVAERERAERRFADVHALSQWMLLDIDDNLSRLPESTSVRERALDYLERLHAEADDDPALLADLAEGYARAGALLAEGPAARSSTRAERSHAAFERAVAIQRWLFAYEPYRIERALALGNTLRRQARAGMGTAHHDVASARVEEALALARSVGERAPEASEPAYLLASTLVTRLRLVGVMREGHGGQPDTALDDAAAAWSALLRVEPVPALEDQEFGMDAAILSRILHEVGREAEAVAVAERAIAVFERFAVPGAHTGIAYAYSTLAFHRRDQGRTDEALALHARTMTIRRARLEERDLPISAFIAFFDSLLDDVELALARPDHDRARPGLDEAGAFLDRMAGKAATPPPPATACTNSACACRARIADLFAPGSRNGGLLEAVEQVPQEVISRLRVAHGLVDDERPETVVENP
jgi:tetratricopeptide (TPR) repeat protein